MNLAKRGAFALWKLIFEDLPQTYLQYKIVMIIDSIEDHTDEKNPCLEKNIMQQYKLVLYTSLALAVGISVGNIIWLIIKYFSY